MRAPPKPNLLKFHRSSSRPELNLQDVPALTPESERCLHNLSAYRPHRLDMRFPRKRCAAVLVALFVGRHGNLYVLLSKRSQTLRTYAGDTALPGGKYEEGDLNIEAVARREAFEEIGLPADPEKVPFLCILDPVPARNELIVYPVVVLILDNTLRPILNAAEVTQLFSHPLPALISTHAPFAELEEPTISYHSFYDHDWRKLGPVRMHSFLTGREAGGIKPIFGLTATILINAAMIGMTPAKPSFEVEAPNQPSAILRIAEMLLTGPRFREALLEEGLTPEQAVGPKWRRRLSDWIERQDKLRKRNSVRGRL